MPKNTELKNSRKRFRKIRDIIKKYKKFYLCPQTKTVWGHNIIPGVRIIKKKILAFLFVALTAVSCAFAGGEERAEKTKPKSADQRK